MKKLMIILVFLVAIAGVVGVSAFNNKGYEGVVGYIDGKAVDTVELENYVDTLLGDAYKKKLTTAEGREELFGHYVNRTLLLEYAKKNIDMKDSFVLNHTMGEVSDDTALLSAVFKKEINDKVEYTEKEVTDLLHTDKRFSDIQEAERAIISQKRLKLFDELMTKLKSAHDIKIAG